MGENCKSRDTRPALLRGSSRGNEIDQGDVEPHSGGIEAGAPPRRHDSNPLDDETHQLTALANVSFGPQTPRVGM